MGGKGGSNLSMAVIREHLAAKGLGLHNDLQNEHSIVGNNPFILMFKEFATNAQYERYGGRPAGNGKHPLGLRPDRAEPRLRRHLHGDPRRSRDEATAIDGWRINGEKMWTTGMHVATHVMCFARTAGNDGDAAGITVFLVPVGRAGVQDRGVSLDLQHAHRPPAGELHRRVGPGRGDLGASRAAGWGSARASSTRTASARRPRSLGAAVYCIEESVKYARVRKPFGEELAKNQAIQWPLVELATQAEMLRLLIRKTAWEMDGMEHREVERQISDKVSMCNYWANRLVCEAADRAMQVHGGIGYSRHKPFEHIYRHHRRYRITEGSEEIQMRKVAAFLFGYLGPRRKELAAAHVGGCRLQERQIKRPTGSAAPPDVRVTRGWASLPSRKGVYWGARKRPRRNSTWRTRPNPWP